MCGIFIHIAKGEVFYNFPEEGKAKIISCLNFRGKDYVSHTVFPIDGYQVNAYHSLLAISNPVVEESKQPVSNTDRSKHLFFNGEYYAENLSSYPTDSHAVFEILSKDGIKGIAKLGNYFAFAYIDSTEKQILISRDAAGTKPLFYFQEEGELIISSSLRAILFCKPQLEISTQSLSSVEYIRHKPTFFPWAESIKDLQAGAVVKFMFQEEKIKAETDSFQSKTKIQKPLSSALVRELFLRSVQQESPRNTQKIALLYSGGLDSSLILLALKELGHEVTCFHVRHTDSKENILVKQLCESLGVELVEININEESFNQDWEKFVAHIDYPIADLAHYLTFKASEAAHSKGIKIMYSGAGADELFLGYNRHKLFGRPFLRKAISRAVWGAVPFVKNTGHQRILKKLNGKTEAEQWYSGLNISEKELPETLLQELLRHYQGWHKWDKCEYLSQVLLAETDMAGYANEVEIRVPFLNVHLWDLMENRTIEEIKLGKHWLKIVFKSLVANLPKRHQELWLMVLSQPKEGFGLNWFNTQEKIQTSPMKHFFDPKVPLSARYLAWIYGKAVIQAWKNQNQLK